MKTINYRNATPLTIAEMKKVTVEHDRGTHSTERYCIPNDESADGKNASDGKISYWECPTPKLSNKCCKRYI